MLSVSSAHSTLAGPEARLFILGVSCILGSRRRSIIHFDLIFPFFRETVVAPLSIIDALEVSLNSSTYMRRSFALVVKSCTGAPRAGAKSTGAPSRAPCPQCQLHPFPSVLLRSRRFLPPDSSKKDQVNRRTPSVREGGMGIFSVIGLKGM